MWLTEGQIDAVDPARTSATAKNISFEPRSRRLLSQNPAFIL